MDNKDLQKRIATDLGFEIGEELTEEKMIDLIAFRVGQLLKGDIDLMMSYLYRLDVEEVKINAALDLSPEPANYTFARLIWARQKERIVTKNKYKQDPIEGWEF